MRTLHVAAMPYPSHQGTQALIHQMLSALSAAGHETHLLCYAHGAFSLHTDYTVHRVRPCFRVHSLRSGPSLAKLALDGMLARALSRLLQVVRPEVIIAHHVEAALAALAARARPFVFVAHTSMAAELPSYFPHPYCKVMAHFGRQLDSFVCLRAARVLAVSPLLARLLEEQGAPQVHAINVPWRLSAPPNTPEREQARARFGFAPSDEVVLYAGNLDAYQGLGPLLAGLELLARRRPMLRLLLGTESDSRDLARSLREGALGARLCLARLCSEESRRALHAAADVVVVPRASPGGIPVKLLDALARGSAVIATHRAGAGLPLASACTLIDDDDPEAWRSALEQHFSQSGRRLPGGAVGRSLIASGHSPAGFVEDTVRHVAALAGA